MTTDSKETWPREVQTQASPTKENYNYNLHHLQPHDVRNILRETDEPLSPPPGPVITVEAMINICVHH